MTGDDDTTPWPGPPESEEEEAEIERCARLIVGDGSRPETEGERQRRARWREMIRQRLRRPAPAYWKRSWSRFQAWIDPELQPDAAQVELAFWRRLAEQQPDNPLYFWHARRLAREVGLLLPEWIERYFDEAAAAIFAEIENPLRGRTNTWLPPALGFSGSRGGGDGPARRYALAVRDLALWDAWNKIGGLIEEGLCPWHALRPDRAAAGVACPLGCQGTKRWADCAKQTPAGVVNVLCGHDGDPLAELCSRVGEPPSEDQIETIRAEVEALATARL